MTLQAEDCIIHMSAELVHVPVPLNRQVCQQIYVDLAGTRAAYDSIDASNPAMIRLYSRRGRAESAALFFPDRLLVVEEWCDIPLSVFEEKLRQLLPRAGAIRQIGPMLLNAATIRSTFALSQMEDARVFLLDRVCGLADRIQTHFRRPLVTGGLRIVLPETSEHDGALHISIESFRHSNNEVFVEVKGIFGKRQIPWEQPEAVIENFRLVRRFITGNIFPFLAHFELSAES